MLSANHQTARFINQQYLKKNKNKKKKKKELDFICPLIQIHENEKLDR